MSDLHVIGWERTSGGEKHTVWFTGTETHSIPYDLYGSKVKIGRSEFIKDAKIFDTFIEAYNVYNTEDVRSGEGAHIRYFTDKEIFALKLKGG